MDAGHLLRCAQLQCLVSLQVTKSLLQGIMCKEGTEWSGRPAGQREYWRDGPSGNRSTINEWEKTSPELKKMVESKNIGNYVYLGD